MQIIESNEVTENDFNIDRSGLSHEKQKEIFNRLAKERVLKFTDITDEIDPDDLVYRFKINENDQKEFENYQMLLKSFEDLRDGDINAKEVLKNQKRLKSDLNEIKIEGKKLIDQKNTIKSITTFF